MGGAVRFTAEAAEDAEKRFGHEGHEGGGVPECLRRGEEVAGKWQARYPAVASMLREGLGDCLTVMSFPEQHRRRLASTNMLENVMRRLRARTRVVGIFPNRPACDRLSGAVLLELHEGWQASDHAWFNMELTS